MKKTLITLSSIFILAVFTNFQVITTSLKVMVLDNMGKAQENAKVRVYASKADYDKEQNPVGELITNKNGNAEFSGLKTIQYFISAVKDAKDNSSNGVTTDILKEFKLNKMKVIIQD